MKDLLSTNLDLPSSIPYFLWDEPMTVAELKRKLNSASVEERNRLLGKNFARGAGYGCLGIYYAAICLAELGRIIEISRTAARILEVFVGVLGQGRSSWIEPDSAI